MNNNTIKEMKEYLERKKEFDSRSLDSDIDLTLHADDPDFEHEE